ncbi:MAG: 50S ribosomal protein L35 [Candidatus Dormibacteria bacterium]
MPKMKTHKGAQKRFSATGSGMILRRRAFRSHLLEHKSSKRKRLYRTKQQMAPQDVRAIRRLIPYL